MPDPRIEYLRGQTNEIYVKVHGKTMVKKGELIVLAQDAQAITGAVADGYGYPVNPYGKGKGATSNYFANNLAGISMKGSESGVTEDIPVAQSGIFRGQIKLGTSATSKHVYPGAMVSACSIGTSGVSTSGTTFDVITLAATEFTTGHVGRAVRKQASATHVDFMLMTRLSGSSIQAR
ncbi:MAG: hypothetical protein V2A69_00840 [Pseudomonadota bacterium]